MLAPSAAVLSVLAALASLAAARTTAAGLTGVVSPAVVSPAAFPDAWVTSEQGFSLQPIDSRTGTAGKAVRLSSSDDYWGLGIAPDGATAYVADFGGGSSLLYPVNLASRTVGKPITVGANPGDARRSPGTAR